MCSRRITSQPIHCSPSLHLPVQTTPLPPPLSSTSPPVCLHLNHLCWAMYKQMHITAKLFFLVKKTNKLHLKAKMYRAMKRSSKIQTLHYFNAYSREVFQIVYHQFYNPLCKDIFHEYYTLPWHALTIGNELIYIECIVCFVKEFVWDDLFPPFHPS